jgi:hypothetical protein
MFLMLPSLSVASLDNNLKVSHSVTTLSTCQALFRPSFTWDNAVNDADRKKVYQNWIQKNLDLAAVDPETTAENFYRQSMGFLESIQREGRVLEKYLDLISQADFEYLYGHKNRILRAMDPDRVRIDHRSGLARMLDSQSIEEARAMERAERRKLVNGFATRSYRHGADIVDSRGFHYSLKQVANRYGDHPIDRSSESIDRALTTLQELALQDSLNSTEMTHLALDIRHLSNPVVEAHFRVILAGELVRIQKTRRAKSLPAIEVIVID